MWEIFREIKSLLGREKIKYWSTPPILRPKLLPSLNSAILYTITISDICIRKLVAMHFQFRQTHATSLFIFHPMPMVFKLYSIIHDFEATRYIGILQITNITTKERFWHSVDYKYTSVLLCTTCIPILKFVVDISTKNETEISVFYFQVSRSTERDRWNDGRANSFRQAARGVIDPRAVAINNRPYRILGCDKIVVDGSNVW